jgi:hypothetical protein
MTGSSTIIASVVTATGLTSLNQLLNDKQSFQPVIGGFVVGTMLLVMALFSESLAASMAILILVSSVLMNGTDLLSKVQS